MSSVLRLRFIFLRGTTKAYMAKMKRVSVRYMKWHKAGLT